MCNESISVPTYLLGRMRRLQITPDEQWSSFAWLLHFLLALPPSAMFLLNQLPYLWIGRLYVKVVCLRFTDSPWASVRAFIWFPRLLFLFLRIPSTTTRHLCVQRRAPTMCGCWRICFRAERNPFPSHHTKTLSGIQSAWEGAWMDGYTCRPGSLTGEFNYSIELLALDKLLGWSYMPDSPCPFNSSNLPYN